MNWYREKTLHVTIQKLNTIFWKIRINIIKTVVKLRNVDRLALYVFILFLHAFAILTYYGHFIDLFLAQ